MARNPEEYTKVKSAHVVANRGRGGGCMVEVLVCGHALEVSRSAHEKGKGRYGRVCPMCTKEKAKAPPVKKRALAALVKSMGGAEALLEYLVSQEKIRAKSRQTLAKAREVKLARLNGHAEATQ